MTDKIMDQEARTAGVGEDPSPETVFTATFPINIRHHAGNPFDVETPFGRPVTIGVGDAFADRDALEHRLNRALDALYEIAGGTPGGSWPETVALAAIRADDLLDAEGAHASTAVSPRPAPSAASDQALRSPSHDE